MRVLIQRVNRASVLVGGKTVGQINRGLLVFVGVGQEDTFKDADFFAEKVVNLRVFDDENGIMNLSLLQKKHEILVVSQFTLYGDCRKGRRPSYSSAMHPDEAQKYYNRFVDTIRAYGFDVKTGVFQEAMTVCIENDGPVTLYINTD